MMCHERVSDEYREMSDKRHAMSKTAPHHGDDVSRPDEMARGLRRTKSRLAALSRASRYFDEARTGDAPACS